MPEFPIVVARPRASKPAEGRTQAGNRGTKEVEQQEADVLVIEQLAVAGLITLGANVLESRQQGHQRVEILQAFNVTRLQRSPAWSGHRCLHAIPELLSGTHQDIAQISCQSPCANLVPNTIGEGRERGFTSKLDPSDKAVGRAQPPSPQPSPARREGARSRFGQRVNSISTGLGLAIGHSVWSQSTWRSGLRSLCCSARRSDLKSRGSRWHETCFDLSLWLDTLEPGDLARRPGLRARPQPGSLWTLASRLEPAAGAPLGLRRVHSLAANRSSLVQETPTPGRRSQARSDFCACCR